MNMNISPIARQMLDSINDFMEASSKKEYRFTEEEDFRIAVQIRRLQNHIAMLKEYEDRRKEENKEQEE